ncbi:hypothetical protein BDV26DRAFT_72326 [Aspergillus bertholletiae]|uniref:Uncharacterized protein n=1 Tax=Aspergillus bertholletiae TaxID=1226010 RepID=A0A5N7BJI8_9EURO|nr:hypothetical protein BDV26DRAFT_72326 [Aspergillus bertholletiae]
MGQTSNSLNCLEIVLDVTPIEDISGIGVAIGCISTAGIVIVINIVYYVLAFQHDLDPFQRTSRTASSSSALDNPASSSPGAFGTAKDQRWSNPVDELVYNCFLRLIRKKVGVLREDRFNKIMMKCLLCMSDLQIVTGLSILISGYASLSEVAIYHWNVFVYLAWFSSLTQFCSITFLRNYLYNHSGQRLWRMMSMVIIVVMLGVAIYPTGSFERISSSPGTPAQCYFGKKSDKDSFAFQAMVISIFSICLACVAHIVRLYKPLSTLLVRYRRYVSKYARSILLRIYKWPQDTRSLKRTFIYHFCLSIFLVLRAALDIYTSMFMEVCAFLVLQNSY